MNRKIGVILSYVAMIFEVLSTLLLTPFILRTLGNAEYGVYKLSASIAAYLLLLDLGVGNAIIRYISKFRANGERENERKFFGISILHYMAIAILVVIVGIILILIFPSVFATGLSQEETALGQKLLFVTLINMFVTMATSPYSNIIVAYEKFGISQGWMIVSTILKIGLTYGALLIGMGSIGIVTVHLIICILTRGFYVFYVNFIMKMRPQFKNIELSFVKEIVSYSGLILAQMIATQINSSVDNILLGALIPNSAAIIGIYGVGIQVVQYFQTIGSSFTGVLMPGVVRLVEDERTNAKTLCSEMVRIGRIIFMVLSLIWVCFVFYGPQFISLWAGSENYDAYYVVLILMPVYTLTLTEAVGNQILWAKNAHKEQTFLKISIVLLNVVLTVFLIKWKPLIGASIGTLISLLLGDVVLMNLIFKKKIGVRLTEYYLGLFKGIVPCLAITALAGYLFGFVGLSGWYGFVINVAVMVAVYAVAMILFGMNKYEKGLAFGAFRKIFKKKAR